MLKLEVKYVFKYLVRYGFIIALILSAAANWRW